ncbi:MAG TPA: hypothetical protein VGI64_17840 [Streptosporangiaceae bacterium]|jgi:hypothetical protein
MTRLSDQPGWYWPCSDGAASPVASNIAANPLTATQVPGASTTPLVVTRSKYGSQGATQAFQQDGSAILGAVSSVTVTGGFQVSNQAGMWGQSNAPAADNFAGWYLDGIDGSFPPLSGGVTIELWTQIDSIVDGGAAAIGGMVLQIGNNQFPCNLAVSGGGGPFPLLAVIAQQNTSTDGFYVLQWGNNTGPNFGAQVNFGSFNFGQVSQVVITTTHTSYTVYVDGAQAASGTYTSGGLGGDTFHELVLSGFSAPFFATLPGPGVYNGSFGHIAVFPQILTAERINTHWQAGIAGMAGEPSNYRIERLLQAGSTQIGRRLILPDIAADVTPVVSCQDIPGQAISGSIGNITQQLLPGVFYIAPTGDMVMQARSAAWNQQPVWTLGEDVSAGEIPYSSDIRYDFDPSRLQNQVQLTQLDDQTVTVPSAQDTELDSQLQFGTVSNLSTGYLDNDASSPLNAGPGLADYANYLATTLAEPGLRLTQVTVDAAANPALWPFVLGASVADTVTVNRRPVGYGQPAISLTGRISQTQRDLAYSATSGVSGKITCLIDAAPQQNALMTDDPVHSLLDGTQVLAW